MLRRKNRALEAALQNSSASDLKEIRDRLRILEAQVAKDRAKEVRKSALVAKIQHRCGYAEEKVVNANIQLAQEHFAELQEVISHLQLGRVSDQKALQTIKQCFSSTPATTPQIDVPVFSAPVFQKEPIVGEDLAFAVSTGTQTGSKRQSFEDLTADTQVSREPTEQPKAPVPPKKLKRLRR